MVPPMVESDKVWHFRGGRSRVMKSAIGGDSPLFMSPDPDQARAFFATKPRALIDKRTTVAEAVQRYIPDGSYLAIGGFGAVRIPTAVVHEIVRVGRKDLGFLGHTSTHDFDLLCAGRCVARVDVAYIVGLEARGLSANARRAVESGEIEVCEWTNYSLVVRLRAAAEGVPFGVARCMVGTDTLARSAAKVIECPFTGVKLVALPALWPDVAVIHVHEADIFGNCRIRGISISDLELARAAKRLVITAERLVPSLDIRSDPSRTVIPYYLVDAVIAVPFGSYPGNMPYEYFSDEPHLMRWLAAGKDPESMERFVDKHIRHNETFEDYLETCGGLARLKELQALESLVDLDAERAEGPVIPEPVVANEADP